MNDRWTEAMVAEYQRKMAQARGTIGPPALAPALEQRKPKPSKYRNRKTADGFDSEKERAEWTSLQAAERNGQIEKLRRQVKYALVVNDIHVCDYVADFVWQCGASTTVADVKSSMTRKLPVYRIKKKLMQACHGIEIQEL